jgi:hypothetical protein
VLVENARGHIHVTVPISKTGADATASARAYGFRRFLQLEVSASVFDLLRVRESVGCRTAEKPGDEPGFSPPESAYNAFFSTGRLRGIRGALIG